jgi:hypothetical protein
VTRCRSRHRNLALGPAEAFIIGTEFAHLHGPHDGRLHITLPRDVATLVGERGWGELPPAARDGLRPPTLTLLQPARRRAGFGLQLVIVSYEFERWQWTTTT